MTTTTAAEGQEPSATSTSGQEPATTSTEGQAPKSQQDYDKIIADLRKENAAARVKAKELDDLKAKLEQDKLTETERLQKQSADLQKAYDAAQAELQELKLSTSVATTAAKLGFADPDDAIKFLDKAELASDTANVENMLKELLKNKPYLAGTQQTFRASSGGATNPARSQSSGEGELSWEKIGNMTSEEYNRRRSQINAWMDKPENRPERYKSR